MKISIIGTGNVVSHLGKAFLMAGHEIIHIWSRTKSHAETLAQQLNASAIDDLCQIGEGCELVVIAVKDDAIIETAHMFRLTHQVVVHTSGSVGMDALKATSNNIGVLYAPQTFVKSISMDYSDLHFCIEANNTETFDTIENLAKSISKHTYQLNSNQRRELHLASVIVNNFGNALNALSQQWLEQKNIPFEILHPLILQTAQKINNGNLWKLQTGPAARGDDKTISTHIEMLKEQPDLQQLYKLMTQIISHATN